MNPVNVASQNPIKVTAREEQSLLKINMRKISESKIEFYVDGKISLLIHSYDMDRIWTICDGPYMDHHNGFVSRP